MAQLQTQHNNLQSEVDDLKKVVSDYREECIDTYQIVNRKLDEIGENRGHQSVGNVEAVEKVEKLVSDKFEELEERNRRRCNLIFFGILESKSENPDVRKNDDFSKTNSLVGKTLGARPYEIRSLYRLGKRSEATRPLKVVMDSESSRDDVLRKYQPEPDEGGKMIYVARDRTITERELHKKLKTELLERRERGEDDLIIRNGRIVRKKMMQQAESEGDKKGERSEHSRLAGTEQKEVASGNVRILQNEKDPTKRKYSNRGNMEGAAKEGSERKDVNQTNSESDMNHDSSGMSQRSFRDSERSA